MEKTKEEEKYRFTKYIETAFIRTRAEFIKKEQKKNALEESLDSGDSLEENHKETEHSDILDAAIALPWNPESILEFLKEHTEEPMEKCLDSLTDQELIIVFAKVFRQMSFKEIGLFLQMDWKKVASVYSYARKKLRKGWETNGIS